MLDFFYWSITFNVQCSVECGLIESLLLSPSPRICWLMFFFSLTIRCSVCRKWFHLQNQMVRFRVHVQWKWFAATYLHFFWIIQWSTYSHDLSSFHISHLHFNWNRKKNIYEIRSSFIVQTPQSTMTDWVLYTVYG